MKRTAQQSPMSPRAGPVAVKKRPTDGTVAALQKVAPFVTETELCKRYLPLLDVLCAMNAEIQLVAESGCVKLTEGFMLVEAGDKKMFADIDPVAAVACSSSMLVALGTCLSEEMRAWADAFRATELRVVEMGGVPAATTRERCEAAIRLCCPWWESPCIVVIDEDPEYDDDVEAFDNSRARL